MHTKATSTEEYLENLPEDRKEVVLKIRKIILDNLPAGFIEVLSYGMLGYVVPHSIYPKGYHCDPKLPLPFISLASQKNFVSLYHMGLYADQELLDWFMQEYSKKSKSKPDVGKSCIRFKKFNDIPFELLGELAKKFTPHQWIELYEKVLKT